MLVSAQQGIDFVLDKHKDVMIYTAAIDRELNENGYILPGLGDSRVWETQVTGNLKYLKKVPIKLY